MVITEVEPLYEKTGIAEMPDILFLRGTNSIVSKILETADSCNSEMMIVEDRTVVITEVEPLYEKTGIAEMPDILFLRGTNSIVSKILETADSCNSEMMIVVPAAGQEMVKQALPKLRILHDKGVSTTILTTGEMDADSVKALSRVATVRIKDGIYGGGIISDKKDVIILLGSEAGKMFTPDMVAIWADHAGLAGFAREYFEYLIKDSNGA